MQRNFQNIFSSYLAELQILQIPRNSTFRDLELHFLNKLPALLSATIHPKSKQDLEYDIAWKAQDRL